MEMEYTRAFTYPAQEPDGLLKWAIAGAVALVPGLGLLAATGYGVEIARRVSQDRAPALPEWSDFADYLRKGLGALVIGLVYWLPLLLFVVCASLPLIIISLTSQSRGSLDGPAGLLSVCIGLVAVVYGVLAGMLVTAALGRYAATDQLGAGLRVTEIIDLVRAKPGLYLAVTLTSGLGGLALTALGALACGVGAFWGAAYAQLAHGHLIGQAYRNIKSAPAD